MRVMRMKPNFSPSPAGVPVKPGPGPEKPGFWLGISESSINFLHPKIQKTPVAPKVSTHKKK
jgi:hypothetical protein